MFLLDTNVISELRRPDKADRNVIAWAGTMPAATFFLSAISILEIELGVLLISRKDAAQGAVLRAWIDDQILPRFDGRILAVDTAVAALREPSCSRSPRRTGRPDRSDGIGSWLDSGHPKRCGLRGGWCCSGQSVGRPLVIARRMD